MNSKKRDFIPLFSVFQTEHTFLATAILVIVIILFVMAPTLLLLMIIIAVIIGIIGLFAVISGLIDMNREAMEYRVVEHIKLT